MTAAPPLPDREPEGEGAALLDELHDTLKTYVVLPSGNAAVAVTLWIAATHGQDAWEHATRLVVKSPVKRCGKSRLLDLLEHLCHAVLVTVNISPAALVRTITATDPPTVLVDEADTIFGTRKQADNNEDLRGIVNAGHQRGRPYTRWDPTHRRLDQCATFAMAALAGIGDMPGTVEDRAVIVTMRRRAPGEQVTPFRRRRHAPGLLDLRDRLHEWVRANQAKLQDADPELPVEDRAADCWEPLAAVADAAGGRWPGLARDACRAMTAAAAGDMEGSFGERLLADLRSVFGNAPALWTATIIEKLAKLDEAPWGDYYGQRITDRGVAKLLRPYGVRSRDVKLGDVVRKGYRREDLYDAWQRYATLSATSATSATSQANQVADGSAPETSATQGNLLTSAVAQVAQVADDPPTSGTVWCVWCGSRAQFDPASDYGRRRLAEGHLDCTVAEGIPSPLWTPTGTVRSTWEPERELDVACGDCGLPDLFDLEDEDDRDRLAGGCTGCGGQWEEIPPRRLVEEVPGP
jgi:hypothetical protein